MTFEKTYGKPKTIKESWDNPCPNSDMIIKGDNQPERSKREDPTCCKSVYVEYASEWGIPSRYERLKSDGMRCSEH